MSSDAVDLRYKYTLDQTTDGSLKRTQKQTMWWELTETDLLETHPKVPKLTNTPPASVHANNSTLHSLQKTSHSHQLP